MDSAEESSTFAGVDYVDLPAVFALSARFENFITRNFLPG